MGLDRAAQIGYSRRSVSYPPLISSAAVILLGSAPFLTVEDAPAPLRACVRFPERRTNRPMPTRRRRILSRLQIRARFGTQKKGRLSSSLLNQCSAQEP